MNKIKILKIIILGIIFYFTIGSILFPGYYSFFFMNKSRIIYFLNFLIYDYIFLYIFLILLTILLIYLENINYLKILTKFINNKYYILFILIILFFDLSWLQFYKMTILPQIIEKQNSINEITIQDYLTTPIDIVFIENNKINEFYSQFESELKLVTIKKENMSQKEIEGSVKAKEIAEIKTEKKQSKKTEMTYETNEKSIERKFIDLLNYLYIKEKLIIVQSIENISDRYIKFNQINDELENDFGIFLNNNIKKNIYESIISEEIKSNLMYRFKANQWIVIDGDISLNSDTDNISFNFDYIPRVKGSVIFNTILPIAKISKDSKALFSNYTNWNLKIFGKILRYDVDNKNHHFLFITYAIFR